jgi:hypothetical protein
MFTLEPPEPETAMSTRSFHRTGAGLLASLGLVIATGTALFAIAAYAQPAKTDPAKEAPKIVPVNPSNPSPLPSGDSKDAPPMGEAPDGTKMPVLKRSEVAVTIIVEDLVIGDGKEATPGCTVTCHYTGKFKDGKEFDSSVKRGEPATFGLEQVVEGWTLGIPGMKVGGIRKLTIPYQLAYGRAGRGGAIPPKSDLIFSIQLVDVK